MSPRKTIRQLILENAVSEKPVRPRDLARDHKIAVASIYRSMTRLRAEGLLPKSSYQARRRVPYAESASDVARAHKPESEAESGPKLPFWEQKDVDAIVNSEVMPDLERLQKLSQMARFGPDAIAIAAIRALEDLGRARGQSVGPGKPLTEDEQIARLARLCIALGREISERAFKVAFPVKSEANHQNEVADSKVGEEC